MRVLRLVAEYGCWPLWEVRANDVSVNLDPAALPVPPELAEDIIAWGHEFEQTLNADYPPSSGFGNTDEAATWLTTGELLAERLGAALSHAGYRVVYGHATDTVERHIRDGRST